MKKDKEKNNRNHINYLLVVALVVAAFIIGNLYNRLKTLEKDNNMANKNVAGQNPEPTVPQKIDISLNDDDPSIGAKDAKVTLIVFSDFLCPYCAAYSGENANMVSVMQNRDSSWQAPLSGIIKNYVQTNKVRLVWKDLPFHGDESIIVHAAARCAHDQDKFWEYHNKLFSLYGGDNKEAYSKDNLKKYAQELKLDEKIFNSCLDSMKYEAKMKEAVTYAQSKGIDGTPATLVNGKLFSGAYSYSAFAAAIDEELKK